MTNLRRIGIVVASAAMVVGAFALVEPSILSSTARSPRAIALLALIAVATSVVNRIVTRRWGRGAGRLTATATVGLAIWLLVMPALRQTTLDEALPAAATGEMTTTAMASDTTPDRSATSTSSSDAASASPNTAALTTLGGTPPAEPPDTAEADSGQPRRLTTGRLKGIGHEASGTVSIYVLADGSAVVRFEEVDIRGSPDPVLYLVPGSKKQTREGGTRVAALKATKGSFNHTAPAVFDLNQPFTVFIWCDRFAVPIANADQERA